MEHHHEEREEGKGTRLRLIFSSVLLIAALSVKYLSVIPSPGWKLLCGLLCGAACLLCGTGVFREAAEGLLHGKALNEQFLMALAAIGAFCVGEFTEGAAVMVLYCLGEALQDAAADKSRGAVTALLASRPDRAFIETEEGIREVLPDEVKKGECLLIRPGERVPLDCVILSGSSSLDTAALTGESIPADVKEGDLICSGCVNLTGVLRARVEKECADSSMQRVADLVEAAAERRSAADRFITRFARVYTPAVVCAALLLAVIPSLLTGQWSEWIRRALSLLVISCPCALVISIPLTLFMGIGAGSRQGILFKGADCLESLAKTTVFAFDKTGTLTEGRFHVDRVLPEKGVTEKKLLLLAAAVETASTHPLAAAIRDAADGDIPAAENITELAGLGIQARLGGRTLSAGNARLMEKTGATVPPSRGEFPGSVIYIAEEGRLLGSILLTDTLKPNSRAAVSALRALGIERTALISGDRKAAAEAAAKTLEIDTVFSSLSPEGKLDAVRSLSGENKKETVAYTGDGINDAPVLAAADTGIAMGAMGSGAAVETADIVLMDDDPLKLAAALRISRSVLRIARQNTVLILLLKGITLIAGALGFAPAGAAVFADVGVCLLAIANASRALRLK